MVNMKFESKPLNWRTFNSTVFATNAPTTTIAELSFRRVHDAGEIKLHNPDKTYTVTHKTGSSMWYLNSVGHGTLDGLDPIIVAEQIGKIGRVMHVTMGDKEYEFLPVSKWKSDFVVRNMADAVLEKSKKERDGEVGTDGILATLRSRGFFKGGYSLSFDDSLPWELRAFLNWMVLLWQRRSVEHGTEYGSSGYP